MAVPCQCSPQKCIIEFEKFFLFWVPINIYRDWKAKLESAYSFMLKYSKITVCIIFSCCMKHQNYQSSLVKPQKRKTPIGHGFKSSFFITGHKSNLSTNLISKPKACLTGINNVACMEVLTDRPREFVHCIDVGFTRFLPVDSLQPVATALQ